MPSEFGAYTKAACNSGIAGRAQAFRGRLNHARERSGLLITSLGFAGKYGAKRAVQEALEKSGLGYTYVTSYCLTSFWGPGLGMLGRAEPPADVIEVVGDGTAKGMSHTPALHSGNGELGRFPPLTCVELFAGLSTCDPAWRGEPNA